MQHNATHSNANRNETMQTIAKRSNEAMQSRAMQSKSMQHRTKQSKAKHRNSKPSNSNQQLFAMHRRVLQA